MDTVTALYGLQIVLFLSACIWLLTYNRRIQKRERRDMEAKNLTAKHNRNMARLDAVIASIREILDGMKRTVEEAK